MVAEEAALAAAAAASSGGGAKHSSSPHNSGSPRSTTPKRAPPPPTQMYQTSTLNSPPVVTIAPTQSLTHLTDSRQVCSQCIGFFPHSFYFYFHLLPLLGHRPSTRAFPGDVSVANWFSRVGLLALHPTLLLSQPSLGSSMVELLLLLWNTVKPVQIKASRLYSSL
jgi:hypothetical protein